MKTMAEKAGLDNSHRTNHSARKRMIQTFNNKDIPPSHIMQLLGHKNLQSINNYGHVAQKQQKSMPRILSGSTSIGQTETHSLVETTKQQSSTPTAEEISPSISAPPLLRQKHINNKLINEYLTLQTTTTVHL